MLQERKNMNDDVNKYFREIIILDGNIKEYRRASVEDIETYRQKNEDKLASLNAHLKEAEQQSNDIKTSRLAEAQKVLDKENQDLKLKLETSEKEFDSKKNQIIQTIFDELFA